MRAYAAVLLLLTGCLADRILLEPDRRPTRYPQLSTMVGDTEVFQAVTDQGMEPDVYVLAFFGNGMTADEPVVELASRFAGARLELWGVNYPGFGRSKGKATLAGVATSARAVYAALAKQAGDKPIVLFGMSLGTAAALHVAAHEQVAGLVLLNAPPLPELILRRYGWWNLWLVALPIALGIPDELDSVENAARVTAPALFIASVDDRIVPIGYQERVMRAYAGDWELIEIPGAGHNSPLPDWIVDAIKARWASWSRSRRASRPRRSQGGEASVQAS